MTPQRTQLRLSLLKLPLQLSHRKLQIDVFKYRDVIVFYDTGSTRDLHYFQATLGPTAKDVGVEAAEELQANVCVQASDVFFRLSNPGDPRAAKAVKEMLKDTKEFHDMLLAHVRKKDPAATLPPARHAWIDFAAVAAESSGGDAAGAKPKVQPVVLEFDEATGAPTTRQMEAQKADAASKVIVSTAVSKTMELRRSCLSATCEA